MCAKLPNPLSAGAWAAGRASTTAGPAASTPGTPAVQRVESTCRGGGGLVCAPRGPNPSRPTFGTHHRSTRSRPPPPPADLQVQNPPGTPFKATASACTCTSTCSGHGACDCSLQGACACDVGYYGESCADRCLSPLVLGTPKPLDDACTQHGRCLASGRPGEVPPAFTLSENCQPEYNGLYLLAGTQNGKPYWSAQPSARKVCPSKTCASGHRRRACVKLLTVAAVLQDAELH